MKRFRSCVARGTLATLSIALLWQGSAAAAELVVGEARAGGEIPVSFRLTGENADDVVGGEITFGEDRFTIARVSRRGVIGAARVHDAGDDSYGEYAVFSSSFSAQTAVGQPWVAASRYHHCDEPYNSFLAIYRVNGKQAIEELGPMPYPTLTGELARSDAANVYCFMSARGSGNR